MSTAAQIFSFARAVLQTDDTDLTDEMLFVFSNDATERILNLRNHWPHLYTEGTLAVVASTQSYVLSSASFSPTTFTTIESVWDDNGYGLALSEKDYQEMAAYYVGDVQTESNRPMLFAVYGGNLYLYPTPSASRTFRIGGYREPVAMDATSDTPDIPTSFHNAIQYGVVAMAVGQTEDYEGANYWAQMANQSATLALRNHFNNTVHRPAQMHGRSRWPMWNYPAWVRNLVP